MNNIPVVLQMDLWRRALALAIQVTVAVGLAFLLMLGLGWTRLGDLFVTALILSTVFYVGYVFLISIIARRVFRGGVAASQALNRQDYGQALEIFEEYAASQERRAWLDRWRTILFLDVSRSGIRENAWLNCGFCCASLGDPDKAIGYYERCLAINPKNLLALSSLNTLLLFKGEPVRPQTDIILRYAFDRGQRGPLRLVANLIPLALGTLVLCPALIVPVLFQADSALLFPALVMGIALFALIARYGYRWLARHIFLSSMLDGFERMKAGDYEGAIHSFERQVNDLALNPWIDQWRLILLLEPSAYSYREWLLLYMITPYIQLGQVERVVALYEECLKLNPANIYARSGLEVFRKLQSAAAQKEGHSSQP